MSSPVGRASEAPPSAWTALLCILLLAGALRVLLYTGYFGSDEVIYIESAFKLLRGDWSVEPYVGANRYGVNLPVAAFAALLGQNEWAAALYSLLSSIAEVGLVTWFGTRMFGLRVGVLAGLLIACLPIHVHFAGRLLADPPLCLAITASFLLFFQGEQRDSGVAYFAAGCAAGFSFWVKPVVVFYVLVFALYPLFFNRFCWKWSWMALGFAVVVLANIALFQVLADDPWYLFRAMSERRASGYLEEGASAGAIVGAPGFYVEYLFAKAYHTGLLGYLALAGAFVGFAAALRGNEPAGSPNRFILWWALGLIAVLSGLVISLDPLLFVPKQTNYMLIFVAPLCLLGGVALARLQGLALWLVCGVTFSSALVLSVLQQASIQSFTSNSKAALSFAREHPSAEVFGSTNAYRASAFESLVRPGEPPARVRSIQDLFPPRSRAVESPPANAHRFAIVDLETMDWASREPIRRLKDVPSCWTKHGTLVPAGLGFGVHALRTVGSMIGSRNLPDRLQRLAMPAPAVVYRVPALSCEGDEIRERPAEKGR